MLSFVRKKKESAEPSDSINSLMFLHLVCRAYIYIQSVQW